MSPYTELVGFDPGTSDCGVFTLCPNTGEMMRYSTIRSAVNKKGVPAILYEAKAYSVAKQAFEWLVEEPGNKIICVEGSAYSKWRAKNKDGQTFVSSSMEQMAACRQSIYCMAAFFLEDFLYYTISPTSAKRVATGSGKSDKKGMAAAIHEMFGIEVKSSAVSDAAAVALAGLEKYRALLKEAERVGLKG